MKRYFLLIIIFVNSSLIYNHDFSHSTRINVGNSSCSCSGGDHGYSSERSFVHGGSDYSYPSYTFSDRSVGRRSTESYRLSVNGPVDPLYGISLNQVQYTCPSIYYDVQGGLGGQRQMLPLEIIFEDQIKSGALLFKGNDIHAYNELMQLHDIVSEQRKSPEFLRHKDFLNNQLYAINDTLNMHFAFQQKHTVTPEIKDFFKQYKYDAYLLERPYYATRLQYYLHEQCLSIFDTVAHAQLANYSHELQPLYSIIADLGWSALSYNVVGKVKNASQLIQGCLLLLDTTTFVAQKSVESLYVFGDSAWQTAHHINNGVHQGLDNVVEVICDPLQFLSHCAQAVSVMSNGMIEAIALGSRCSFAMDMAIYDPVNAAVLLKEISAQVEPIKQYIDSSALQLTKMPVGRILEATVASTVEGVAWGAIGRLCKFTVKNIPVMTEAIRDGIAVSEIAMTAEGIPVRIFAPKMVECMEATNTVAKTKTTAAHVSAVTKMRGKHGNLYEKLTSSNKTRPLNRLKGKDLLGIENVTIKGYDHLPKRIVLDNYKHYLEPELWLNQKGKLDPSGWHHDPGKTIERIKRVNGHKIEIIEKELHSSGIYRFDWGVEGMNRTKQSTFFPHTWSREMVQKKIIEAFKYARKHNHVPEVQKKGSFVINGFTSEGIKIKVVIKEGRVTTAYPLWPSEKI